MPGGIAVFDFDADGHLDLFLANGGELPAGRKTRPEHTNRLLRNAGGMHFEDVTGRAGLAGNDYAFGASAADYDGDGRPDLLVSHIRGITLYRNQGNGMFEDVTAQAGLDNHGRWSVGGAWFDYDGDGDLDLYVVNYVLWDPKSERECLTAGRIDFCHPRYYEPQPGALFRNDGNGTFTDVSQQSGIAQHRGKGMAATVADWNGDGRPDLFVTNDRMPAFLFLNRGNGRFEEGGLEAGVAVPGDGKPVSGMGADTQDYDRDGYPDLVYTALRDETFPLYRGAAGGLFIDASGTSKLAPHSRPFAGWGVMFTDVDCDGRLDIAAATGDALSGKVDSARQGPVVWFRNAGGRFEAAVPLTGPAMWRGLVAADLDGDGCDDLVVTALDAPARVLRNPCLASGKAAASRKWTGSSAVGYASSLWESSGQSSSSRQR